MSFVEKKTFARVFSEFEQTAIGWKFSDAISRCDRNIQTVIARIACILQTHTLCQRSMLYQQYQTNLT